MQKNRNFYAYPKILKMNNKKHFKNVPRKEVVNELQSVKLQCLHDNETQTSKDQTDELAFYTCATLDEIMKELKRKGCFTDDYMAIYGLEPSPSGESGEIKPLHKQQLVKMETKTEETANCEAICADALKRLEELENENVKLSQQNHQLNEKLEESEEKLGNMLHKVEKLDAEINRTGQEANKIGDDLQGAIGLVDDINNIQLENQQLSAMNSRDDQKIIDDLRRQLENEVAKLRKCQQDNVKLLEEATDHEINLKELKDLNNELESERNNLLNENVKLKNRLNILQPDQEHQYLAKEKNDTHQMHEDFLPSNSEQSKLETGMENYSNEKTEHISENAANEPPSSSQRNDPDDERNNKKSSKTLISDENEENLKASELQQNKQSQNNKKSKHKQLSREHQKYALLDDFVNKKSVALKYNLQQGRGFEKEFRNILDDFIHECSYCFCRLLSIQSKVYIICHKLCHRGIDTLTFRELAYLHKKIYAQADQLIPGCLLNMIMSDHKEQVERMLVPVVKPRLVANKNTHVIPSVREVSAIDQKCCCCKNELCCNNSEEMLKNKVNKLEKDIEIARGYLETLKNIPLETTEAADNGDSSDTNNSTYRASSPVTMQQKPRSSKHIKKHKSRSMIHPD